MVLPPLIFAFLAKNLTFVNALAAAEAYGYHRAYRRMIEGMLKLGIDKSQRVVIQKQLKSAIRAPGTAYEVITSPEVSKFISQYGEYLLKATNLQVPPFFTILAKLLFKRTPLGKIVDILHKSASKKKG